MLNKPDEAMNIYKKINPIEHTKSKEGLQKYKAEPFALEADIYSEGHMAGRGGWTWYTGSSSWLYETQIRYILGLRVYHGKLTIKPCVPKEWKEFEVKFKWKHATYMIKYKQVGEYKVVLNDEQLKSENSEIKLEESGEHEIKVFF